MQSSTKIPSILAGVAGEYYVAAELSRRGYIASVSLKNTRGIDILATNQDGTRSITIQVKTNQLAKREWVLNCKAEDFVADNHYYIFVSLSGQLSRPNFYIVPSLEVANQITQGHAEWLRTPGRNGRMHVDNKMRKFIDQENDYLEKWDTLNL